MPVVVVWYRDSAEKLLQPEVCTCAMCGASLCRNSFMTPMKLGLAKEHLFHTILPVAQCSKCKNRRIMATQAPSKLCLPEAAVLTSEVDVLLKRTIRMNLTDWLCRTYRKHFNQSALRATYVDLLGTNFQVTEAVGSVRIQQALFLYLHQGIPDARSLAKVVLLCFQQAELPRLEEEIRWVCARFGAVLAVDGSSAPLQEAKQYKRKKQQMQGAAANEGPGAAIRVLGLFDVPLCPTAFVRSEGRPAVAELVGFLISQACMVDAEALPVGWVQDNTEKIWPSMVHVITKLMHAHEAAGRIKISQATKEVFGFYVGIDPKHVEWRLQDALDSRSADFMHAGWALRTMFSKLFNPAARSMDEDLDVEMEDAAPQGWEHIWKAWLLNERVTASVKVGRDTAAAFQRALKGDAADAARFRADRCLPPRALLSNFLTLMGCKEEAKSLWDVGSVEDTYLAEPKAFTQWFDKAIAAWLRTAMAYICSLSISSSSVPS